MKLNNFTEGWRGLKKSNDMNLIFEKSDEKKIRTHVYLKASWKTPHPARENLELIMKNQ